jgi:Family of unknown function (DUF7002)
VIVLPVNLEPIITYWTYCYHVTALVNLRGIRRSGILLPAATLFRTVDQSELLSCRRTHDVQLRFQNQEILVRNQVPLDPDHIDLGSTETFEEYVACLNTHVFFWPGTATGPTFDGVRMSRRTAGVKSAMIRAPTRSLLEANEGSIVHLSTCNSGASWVKEGRKSQRGIGVFQRAESFADPAERIEEIMFRGSVNLPNDSECSTGFGQRWRSLFAQTNCRPHVLQSPSKNDPW